MLIAHNGADVQRKGLCVINLIDTSGTVYHGVQEQIWGSISRHLPRRSWTSSPRKYVPGALNFSLFINLDSDVLMSHGVADKNYLWRKSDDGERALTRGHRTDVLVPGPMLQRRVTKSKVLAIDGDHVHSVGWPRLDLLLARQAQVRSRLRRRGRRRLRVLWAPTHDFVKKGDGEVTLSSYPAFEEYLEPLRKHFDVEVSEHPRNRGKGNSRRPTTDQLVDADVVISDFGTMVYEAWALGKQVIFPHWINGEALTHAHRRAAENTIYTERIGLHADSFDELVEMIQERREPDPRLEKFLADYLDPRYRGTSGKRIADLLLRLDRERNG